MSSLLDPTLERALAQDLTALKNTKLPIITVSASFKEDLKGFFNFPENETIPDVVFSRAHYSMALGIAVTVWGKRMDPSKAWVVDPTNHIKPEDWTKIALTEVIGQTIARYPLLQTVKSIIDRFGRKKLPILNSITPPLLHLTQNLTQPLLSLHIAAGNILAEQGHKVVQVITDPHVRDEYVVNSPRLNMKFCVFDDNTKTEFLEKASLLGIKADPDRVIVTGPPIDPRIIASRNKKHPWRSGPLKLCITTGGLGTNKAEIRVLLQQLLPELRRRPSPYQLLIYASTHEDIAQMVKETAHHFHVALGEVDDPKAHLRLLYHPQLVDANELLIKYGFPWAHGFLTKPSGDMAYDAAAAGCFLLTLKEWGEWEFNVRHVFEQKEIARRAESSAILKQLDALKAASGKSQSWIESAMNHALKLEPLFLNGTQNIIKVVEKWEKKKA